MTTEPTPQATEADVVTAAAEVRTAWQAKEFSDAHHRYMIARLEYEWPALALAIRRLCSKHEDATRCPSEYDGAGYEAGTVSCDRGRDHAGAHEGEGYDSERYQWQREGQQYVPVTCGVKHPHAKHDWHACERVPGHAGDHRDPNSNTWPWQPADTYCYQKGPADHQGACLIPKAHFGDHRDSQGNTWAGNRCNAKHPGEALHFRGVQCQRDTGHEGDHGRAGIYWKQDAQLNTALPDALTCGEPSAMTPTKHCDLNEGHDGDHTWQRAQDMRAGLEQPARVPAVCRNRRPHDSRGIACALAAGHHGMHAGQHVPGHGPLLRWEDAPRPCPSSLTDYVHCKLTEGHAGNHENGGTDWQDDA